MVTSAADDAHEVSTWIRKLENKQDDSRKKCIYKNVCECVCECGHGHIQT